ncbi:unannotated protein [freshwater metagenome]|uniref:Unannotated protein n=1 Tax=freshwater metagenome TaxID=449393 RepID=A0A6J6H206_9ZZZZ
MSRTSGINFANFAPCSPRVSLEYENPVASSACDNSIGLLTLIFCGWPLLIATNAPPPRVALQIVPPASNGA